MTRRAYATRKSAPQATSATSALVGSRKGRRAVSPAISTVILTGAIVAMLLAAIPLSRNLLDSRTAEYEFSAMEQSMQTTALQLDDVAWTMGRTQTTYYTSRFGWASFKPLALNYAVYIDQGQGYYSLANYSTGILMFNMISSQFSLGNNYFESLYPTNRSFLLNGVSAPISHVYVVQKMPMSDGSFIRVVVAPSIRMLNSTVTTNATQNYLKFHLPILAPSGYSGTFQSIRLAGSTVSVNMTNSVQKVKVQISYPSSSAGFDQTFFNFDSATKEIAVTSGTIIEFYTMNVSVSMGVD